MDYNAVAKIFGEARSPHSGKPIANNTRVFMRPTPNGGKPEYAIRLHQTDILTFRPDGSVIYNTGGWQTVTTKQRMNEYGPARVWSDRGTWYIGVSSQGQAPYDAPAVYRDGCRVRGERIFGAAKDDKAPQKLRAAVGAYVKAYMGLLTSGKMEAPGLGDCLICQLARQHADHRDASHIRAHIKERYYVPSLVWAAMHATGASQAEQQTVRALQYKDCTVWPGEWINKQIAKHLRKYMLRQLGMAA